MADGVSDFSGKVAVITGGASGIGLAIAKQLGAAGATLVIADIETQVLDTAIKGLADAGFEAIGVRTDVSDRAQVKALADAAWDRFGAVHIVINNAGVAVFGPTQSMSQEDWAWSMNVNLWGPIHGVEAFVPRRVEQGGTFSWVSMTVPSWPTQITSREIRQFFIQMERLPSSS